MSELRFPDISAAAAAGLQAGAEVILQAAVDGAPFDTGALAASGSVQVDGAKAAIGFSDPKAVAAHENLHDHLRNGKRAKFLELAVAENRDEALRLVAEAIQRALS